MHQLITLGWKNRTDTFETYYKIINNYEIIVSKHISEHKWQCTLVEWFGEKSDEITINYDCSYDWVIEFEKILSKAK